MGSKSQEGFQIDKCDNRPTERASRNKTGAETEARVEGDVSTEERRDHTHNDTAGLLERGEARLGQRKELSRRETQNTRQAKTQDKRLLGRSTARLGQRKELSRRETQNTRQAKTKDKRLLGRSTARLDQRKTFCGEAKC